MAIYHLQAKSVSRSDQRSAVGAAAYRAGQRLRDERTGRLHNYSHRHDVSHTEIVWPSELAARELSWARDRAALWNAAERAENRRNSRVAREYQVALPAELTALARQELARRFAHEIAERHHVAVDLAIHAPPATGDARNHHAHLLATTREVGESGLGAKAGLDMSYPQRLQRGMHSGLEELKVLRERWAVLANEALQAAGLAVRVDHRSLAAQGIDREPLPQIPIGALHRERHGIRSEVADRIREQYRARVQARAHAAPQTAPVAEPTAAQAAGSEGLEQVRQQAREAWLRMRQGLGAASPAHGVDIAEATRGVDQDLHLVMAARMVLLDAERREDHAYLSAADHCACLIEYHTGARGRDALGLLITDSQVLTLERRRECRAPSTQAGRGRCDCAGVAQRIEPRGGGGCHVGADSTLARDR